MRTLSRSLIPLFATLLLVAACDKKDDKKADDKKAVDKKADDKQADDKIANDKQYDAEPPQPDPAAAVLTLGAAKIMEKDKPDEAIEILADGTVKMGPEHTFKISADGKISKADGAEIGQVAADGTLSLGGKPSGVVLNDTGLTLTAPNGKTATVKFNEDGSVVTDPPAGDGLQMTAEGCTGPMVKTCGVVMTMLVLLSEPAPAGEAKELDTAVAEPKVVEKK